MSDIQQFPFSGVENITEVISPEAKAALHVNIDLIMDLIIRKKDAAGNHIPQPSPDFDEIHPATADKLVAELNALKATIDAAPEA